MLLLMLVGADPHPSQLQTWPCCWWAGQEVDKMDWGV